MHCDVCGSDSDRLYEFDGKELCAGCMADSTVLDEGTASGSKCFRCGASGDKYELYDLDGQILCESCFDDEIEELRLPDEPDDDRQAGS